MKQWITLFLLLIVLPLAGAAKGHMTLLAVAETPSGMKGSTADLELEITQGSGRVFIDSFPLTKIDTQISTRFAKEVACSFENVDCSNLDFFYVIRSSSSIIGGPSAGGALSVLTAALLDNKEVSENIAMTGTINSGGFIGPVSGLPQKLEAAKERGITKVLVPPGSMIVNESNQTINLVELASKLGIEVEEVSHLGEAMALFTGKPKPAMNEFLEIDPTYRVTMLKLADTLCNRTKTLMGEVKPYQINKSMMGPVLNYTKLANAAKETGGLYSRASYCFGANAKLSQLIAWKTLNRSMLALELTKLKHNVLMQKANLPAYKSLTDLETYTAVIERLTESLSSINDSFNALSDNFTREAAYAYGYAKERLYSAQSWAQFFGTSSDKISFENMETPCLQKILEASERLDYLKVYLPKEALFDLEEGLKRAKGYSAAGSYELCIFKASLVKAQTDAVLGSIGTSKAGLSKVLDEMLKYIHEGIVQQTKKGNFPIVGYSYYEYANSLKKTNIVSAFIYAEYSLELSNLDMYFPKEEGRKITMFRPREILMLAIGMILGLTITYGITRIRIKGISRMRIKTHPGARGTRSGKKR